MSIWYWGGNEMKLKSRIVVFILSFLAWIMLTSLSDIQEILAGVAVAFIVSLLAGHFLITTEKKNPLPKRILLSFAYIARFLWEMIKANIHVAYIVMHPLLPIKPGIVKIRTTLTKDTSLTILSNSITLTPGTLTIDIDPDNKNLYIHWIDVLSTDPEENTKIIGSRFEPIISEVLE